MQPVDFELCTSVHYRDIGSGHPVGQSHGVPNVTQSMSMLSPCFRLLDPVFRGEPGLAPSHNAALCASTEFQDGAVTMLLGAFELRHSVKVYQAQRVAFTETLYDMFGSD